MEEELKRESQKMEMLRRKNGQGCGIKEERPLIL